jgi:hypothetical protein
LSVAVLVVFAGGVVGCGQAVEVGVSVDGGTLQGYNQVGVDGLAGAFCRAKVGGKNVICIRFREQKNSGWVVEKNPTT